MKKLIYAIFLLPILTFAQSKVNINQIPSTTITPSSLSTNSTVPTSLAVYNAIPTVDPSALAPILVGNVINENFNNLASWTNVGTATMTTSGNQLSLVNTSGSFSTGNYIRYDANGVTNMESFTETFDLYPGTISTTSYGTVMNWESQGAYQQATIRAVFRQNTGNMGYIEFYGYNNGTLIGSQTSTNGLSFSAGDHLVVTAKRIKNKFIVSVYNANTGYRNTSELDVDVSSGTFTYLLPNSYKFGLGCAGSTSGSPHLIANFKVNNDDNKNPQIIVLCDSKWTGYTTSNIQYRVADVINNTTNAVVVTNGGPGNLIEDINSAEVTTYSAGIEIINLGINNVQAGQSLATIESRYTTLVNARVAAGRVLGTDLFVCLLEPGPNYNLTYAATAASFNSWILSGSGFPSNSIIDLYTPNYLNSSTPLDPAKTIDGIHLNNAGQKTDANVIISFLGTKLTPKTRKTGNFYPIVYNSSGNVTLGDQKGTSIKPLYQLDIYTPLMTSSNAVTQQHWSVSGNDDGGYAGSIGASHASIFGGASRNVGSGSQVLVVKSSSYSGIDMLNGGIGFLGKTNATVGSFPSISTYSLYLSPGNASTGAFGRLAIGNNTSPTAFLDIPASDNNNQIASIRARSGANYPSSFNGGELFNFSNRLYANNGTSSAQVFALDKADNISTATDANYTVATPSNSSFEQLFKLPTITANRNFALVSASSYTGRTLKILNNNTSAFNWIFTSATVNDPYGNTVTNIPRGVTIIESDGTNWNILDQSASGTSTTVLHGGNTYSSVSLISDVSGVLPIANGGTGSSTNVLPIKGNYTATGTATTTVTVTIGQTMANTSYVVSITPKDLITAVNYYVTNQTTTTFDVTFVSGLTGSINFDFIVTP